MVSLKINFSKRDFVWIVPLFVVLAVTVAYAYGGSAPAVMGHTGEKLFLSIGVK